MALHSADTGRQAQASARRSGCRQAPVLWDRLGLRALPPCPLRARRRPEVTRAAMAAGAVERPFL